MKKPWFSIIVPVYNVESYLEKCVESILRQTFSDFEILLIDDGSTDESSQICDNYASRYENIRTIHQKNMGLGKARNTGLREATGMYIAFVDSDDWIDENLYSAMYEKSIVTKPDIINYGYKKICNNQIALEEHAIFAEGTYEVTAIKTIILPTSIAKERAFDQVNLPVQLSACMCVYRREFVVQNNIWFHSESEVLCEDWLFNIECLCCAQRMVVVHDCYYNYNTRINSLSSSYKTDAYERRKVLYQKYRDALLRTGNLCSVQNKRLRNFWMESIYCCYLIELNAPIWTDAVVERIERLCEDVEFQTYIKDLRVHNCTLKGLLFVAIVNTHQHWILRFVYGIKRRMSKRMFGCETFNKLKNKGIQRSVKDGWAK